MIFYILKINILDYDFKLCYSKNTKGTAARKGVGLIYRYVNRDIMNIPNWIKSLKSKWFFIRITPVLM